MEASYTIKSDGLDNIRIKEAINSLRYKPVKSTTLERLRICAEANRLFKDLSQPLQLGNTMNYILERINKPVEPHDLLVGRILEEVPDEAGEAFFQETIGSMGARPYCMKDWGHESFAWERLVKLGLPGLEEFAERELEKRQSAGAAKETLDFLESIILIYRSFKRYARLYGEASQEVGLEAAAQSCFAVADRAPQTFREALQLVWLIGLVYCTICAMNPTLTFGRMDEYLYPFYKKDLAEGILTEEAAGDLIEDFYCKNSLVMGRGEHSMSGGTYDSENETTWERNLNYDAPQYVILGGTRKEGESCANELTRIFLERITPRLENPVILLRYTDDFPADLWKLACSKMCANSSMMVYNDKVIIPALIRCGIKTEDAATYVMYGCNWPQIPGVQRLNSDIGISIAGCLSHVLEQIHEEDDCEAVTLDDIYQRFNKQVSSEMAISSNKYRAKRAELRGTRPGWLYVDDCFLTGSVENACSWETGSLKYEGVLCGFGNAVSIIDLFTALDEIVFKTKKHTLVDFISALKNDFKGYEILHQQYLNAPKFGQDDDAVDSHACRVMSMLYKSVDEITQKGNKDEITVMCSLNGGGEPAPGSSTKGLTAMFRSLAKLPKDLICSGHVNMKINPGLIKGEKNLNTFSTLLRTYFALGGIQSQLSVTDTEELRRAQVEPEKYRDLMVRIAGYSAAFVDMAKQAQDIIIKREEMAEC